MAEEVPDSFSEVLEVRDWLPFIDYDEIQAKIVTITQMETKLSLLGVETTDSIGWDNVVFTFAKVPTDVANLAVKPMLGVVGEEGEGLV